MRNTYYIMVKLNEYLVYGAQYVYPMSLNRTKFSNVHPHNYIVHIYDLIVDV